MMTLLKLAPALLLAFVFSVGCASYDRRAGVENFWRETSLVEIQDGATTRAQILELLGPPSQLIALGDRVVFYYLRERTRGRIGVFVLYNMQTENISYDRAIFFFDEEGVLVEHSFSREEIPLG